MKNKNNYTFKFLFNILESQHDFSNILKHVIYNFALIKLAHNKLTQKPKKSVKIMLMFRIFNLFLFNCVIFYIVFCSQHFIWQILLFYYMPWIIMWVFISITISKLFHTSHSSISNVHWNFSCVF